MPSPQAKAAFIEALPFPSAPGWVYVVAMHAFVAAFALFGLAKMTPMRLEPAVVVLIGLLVIWSEVYGIYCHFRSARRLPSDQPAMEVHRWVDSLGRVRTEPIAERSLSQLQAVAPRALLFGGFAYNAVSFMFRPASAMAPT